MKFAFSAKIYKVGINPCVKVPYEITEKMTPVKGYIPVKGKISGHPFRQTLCPVKNAEYRLYVNGPMLKGGKVENGDTAHFILEQDKKPLTAKDIFLPPIFRKELRKARLYNSFEELMPSRRKEILNYLNHLKTEEALKRNIDKVVSQLKKLRK